LPPFSGDGHPPSKTRVFITMESWNRRQFNLVICDASNTRLPLGQLQLASLLHSAATCRPGLRAMVPSQRTPELSQSPSGIWEDSVWNFLYRTPRTFPHPRRHRFFCRLATPPPQLLGSPPGEFRSTRPGSPVILERRWGPFAIANIFPSPGEFLPSQTLPSSFFCPNTTHLHPCMFTSVAQSGKSSQRYLTINGQRLFFKPGFNHRRFPGTAHRSFSPDRRPPSALQTSLKNHHQHASEERDRLEHVSTGGCTSGPHQASN